MYILRRSPLRKSSVELGLYSIGIDSSILLLCQFYITTYYQLLFQHLFASILNLDTMYNSS